MRKQKLSPELQAVRNSLPMAQRNFSVEEAAAVIGCGRAYAFDLIAKKKLKTIKEGRRRFVPGVVLERFITESAKRAA